MARLLDGCGRIQPGAAGDPAQLERRAADPALEPLFDEARAEPVFVKNLENVQGDERDVLIAALPATVATRAGGCMTSARSTSRAASSA